MPSVISHISLAAKHGQAPGNGAGASTSDPRHGGRPFREETFVRAARLRAPPQGACGEIWTRLELEFRTTALVCTHAKPLLRTMNVSGEVPCARPPVDVQGSRRGAHPPERNLQRASTPVPRMPGHCANQGQWGCAWPRRGGSSA
jgi:hypothetical protein